jgi:hypothetical protein
MPKVGLMSQFSRPYQIALAVLVVAAAAWFLAFRPHSSTETTAPSKPPTAPGVAGLTKDIAKAHAAVAASEQNARELQKRSEVPVAVTGGTAAAHTSSVPAATKVTVTKTHVAAPSTTAKSVTVKRGSIHAYAGAGRVPNRQVLVERALSEGKPVVILFWNKKGSDDRATKLQLELLELDHHVIHKLLHSGNNSVKKLLVANHMYLGPFAAFFANAKQVAEFGSVTRGVQVYSTPTVIVIGKSHQAHVLTGFTDAFAMQQAIEEARSS